MRSGRAFSASHARRGTLALCFGALVLLPGCGGNSEGDKIPTDQANRMIALVRLADQQSSAGTCSGAQDKVRSAQAVLQTVPNSVDKDVRQGIADSLAHLNSLIRSECQRPHKTQTQTEQQTTPTETTQTQTTQTQTTTTPSTTTPTTTTPSTTTPTTTTPSTTTPTTTGTHTTTGTGGASPPSAGGGAGQG